MEKPLGAQDDLEIPQPLREMAEEAVATARLASREIGTLMAALGQQAEKTNGELAASALEIQSAMLGLAEDSIFNGFDMALRMAGARDMGELLRLQAEFGTAQVKVFERQAKVLGQMVSEAADRTAKTID